MYRKQFLLTNKNIKPIEGWSSKNILNYTIYYDNNIEYSYIARNKKEIHLLGEMYDYKNPNFTNTEILVKIDNKFAFYKEKDLHCRKFFKLHK